MSGAPAPAATGVNQNQGAAATLALLSVLQNAQRFTTIPE